jgi:predicted Fe-S protein YdhL (DUF1289 family)
MRFGFTSFHCLIFQPKTAMESPCEKICIVDPPSGLCRGCGRSLAEIARWTAYSDNERARIMAELPQRLDTINGRAMPGPRE